MEQFLRRLEKLGFGLSDEDIADMIWLAMQMGPAIAVETPDKTEEEQELPQDAEHGGLSTTPTAQTTPTNALQRQSPAVSAFASDSVSRPPESETSTVGVPFQAPAVTALPNALDLGRSLRPLMRKVPSATQFELDSEATVNQVIEKQIWQPVLLPAPERWLDLELVIEETPLNLVWQQTLDELRRKVLERTGAFRNVRSWTLRNQNGKPQLISRYAGEAGSRTGQPQELVHPSGRRLVMVISDGQSELWQSSQLQSDLNVWQSEQPAPNLHAWLHYWANHGPAVMVQLLPKWMWEQSALEFGIPVQLLSIFPGIANEQWAAMGLSTRQRRRVDEDPVLKMPVVTLEADSFETWANVVAAVGVAPTPGFVFNLNDLKQYQEGAETTPSRLTEISDEALIDRFLATASPTAQQLAAMMAAVPVSIPVIHLLQANFLQKSIPVHVAEVFMSGLLQQTGTNEKTHQPIYDFKSKEVRRLLNQAYPDYKTQQVVSVLSEAIGKKLGREDLNSFAAFLSLDPEVLELGDDDQERIVQRFAALLPEVLRNLGGAYATLADTAELLARQPKLLETEITTETSEFPPEFPDFPALEDFDYITPVIRFEESRENDIGLVSEVKTVEVATVTIASSISEDEIFNALAPIRERITFIASEQHNTTLVVYRTLTANDLHILVSQPTGEYSFHSVDLSVLEIPLTDLIALTLEELGVQREPTFLRAGAERRQTQKLAELYQLLIQPIAQCLPSNPNALVVFVPQEQLLLCPFAALLDAEGSYLFQKYTILISSMQILEKPRKRQGHARQDFLSILVVGNPTMPVLTSKVGANPQQLPPLPDAEQESKTVAALLNAQLLIGNEATRASVVAQMPSASIIHLATHVLSDNSLGLESAIALAPDGTGEPNDGLLTATEIVHMQLNAELVVLSGGNNGESAINLSQSFITAGVSSVLVPLWSVSGITTDIFMSEFYRQLQMHNEVHALRHAMLTIMATYPNPRYWAAFTLIGEIK